MPSFSVQETLECALQEYLAGQFPEADETEVNWHLITVTVMEDPCEECGTPTPVPVWRLSLVFFYGPEEDRRMTALAATIPYPMLFDGDAEPLLAVAEQMVSDFRFSVQMVVDGLEEDLAKVAESEGGSAD